MIPLSVRPILQEAENLASQAGLGMGTTSQLAEKLRVLTLL
jgi:hypothetical protein